MVLYPSSTLIFLPDIFFSFIPSQVHHHVLLKLDKGLVSTISFITSIWNKTENNNDTSHVHKYGTRMELSVTFWNQRLSFLGKLPITMKIWIYKWTCVHSLLIPKYSLTLASSYKWYHTRNRFFFLVILNKKLFIILESTGHTPGVSWPNCHTVL